jgi:hypothetical protein
VSSSHLECLKRKEGMNINNEPLSSGIAHAYNPNYSKGRDGEDGGSRPALAKS